MPNEQPVILGPINFKFLGGSITASPAKSFMGKTGMVELPDRIVLKVEGNSTTLTAAAIEGIVHFSTLDKVQPFLEKMQKAEQDGQQD